jgi:hypothetical protein
MFVRARVKRINLKRVTIMALALLMVFNNLVYGKHHDLKIVGRIVAYEFSITDLLLLTDVESRKGLIVRIDKRVKGQETSHYVLVRYMYVAPTTKSTSEIFDLTKRWEFNLIRDRICDSPLPKDKEAKGSEMKGYETIAMPAVVWVVETEKQKVPRDKILPCYQLLNGDFKPLGD